MRATPMCRTMQNGWLHGRRLHYKLQIVNYKLRNDLIINHKL